MPVFRGEVVTASRDRYSDLFHAFPNSYGTLGYSVRLKIELEEVKPFVALKHLRFHRLDDLVAEMDRIIVLDHGRIVEDGTHQQLLAKKGVYARLWAHQSGGFIEE